MALGILKSLRGHICSLRKNIEDRNHNQAIQNISKFKEALIYACRKMYQHVNVDKLGQMDFYPMVEGKTELLECNKEYAESILTLLEINLASLLMERAMCN